MIVVFNAAHFSALWQAILEELFGSFTPSGISISSLTPCLGIFWITFRIFCFGLLSRLKTNTYRPKSHLSTSWRPLMWAHTWQWPLWLYEKQAGQCLLSSHVTKQAFCSTIFSTRQLVICIQVSTLLSVVTVLYKCMFRRFEGWG